MPFEASDDTELPDPDDGPDEASDAQNREGQQPQRIMDRRDCMECDRSGWPVHAKREREAEKSYKRLAMPLTTAMKIGM